MDAALGDLADTDVLIEQGKVAAVGRGLSAGDAVVIEARGMILMPGMADGSATRRKAPQRVQPSISAADSIDGSMPSKKPFISHEKKQMWTAIWGSSRPR